MAEFGTEKMVNIILCSVFLEIAAWQDLRKKAVGLWVYGLFGVFGVGLRLWQKDTAAGGYGAMVGIALLLMSRISDGAIGYGDGLFFTVSGIYLGLRLNLQLFLFGSFLCGTVCLLVFLVGLSKGENTRKKTVPFLPFMIPVWIWMVSCWTEVYL